MNIVLLELVPGTEDVFIFFPRLKINCLVSIATIATSPSLCAVQPKHTAPIIYQVSQQGLLYIVSLVYIRYVIEYVLGIFFLLFMSRAAKLGFINYHSILHYTTIKKNQEWTRSRSRKWCGQGKLHEMLGRFTFLDWDRKEDLRSNIKFCRIIVSIFVRWFSSSNIPD